LEFLRSCHRAAPFLFFNGNTFAAIGRQIVGAVFSELPSARQREIISAVGHYIAGVLDWQPMVDIIHSLCETAALAPGDLVQTLRGTAHGVIVRILEDGRVVWRTDVGSELIALPETLQKTPAS
jgi:hypothetical protein